MRNVLDNDTQQQIRALGRLGWTLSRIQETTGVRRETVSGYLKAAGIAANVHYAPVYHHSFYRERFGYKPGLCPRAEAAYLEILTLPIFPALTDADQDYVVSTVTSLRDLS